MKKRYLLFPLIPFLAVSFLYNVDFLSNLEKNYAPDIETSIERPVVIVIASYNNKEYYKHNLDSVFSQKYTNFKVIYTSDASTDGTADLVKAYVKENGFEDRFTLIVNKENKGGSYNYYHMSHMCESNEIVCMLDGDDAFANSGVLSRVNRAYAADKVWMTYGGLYEKKMGADGTLIINPNKYLDNFYVKYKNGPTSTRVLKNRGHRLVTFSRFHHLRTFYAGLYCSIPKENFLKNGEFYKISWDVVLMLLLIDRAGDHAFYFVDPMYEYNIDNPISDFRQARLKQSFVAFTMYFIKKLEAFSSREEFLGKGL